MPSIGHTIEIDRPSAVVFAVLSNFANDIQWRANVLDMVAMGKPSDLGGIWSRQIEVRQVPGRVIRTEAVITAFEPNRLIRVRRASGPVRPEAVYELLDIDGRTRIDFRIDVELSGASWLLWPVVILLLNAAIKPALAGDFARLREFVEAAGR